ncbi:cytochrome aa3 quinol oxidase subunit II [Ammoniphilus sp. YIM 78166]|uniref:cytochrome aa3 quinol oxidase subunit II n=1 Tax=Ammoniphilus sp. YIM 78166 TaxID=1644106 RepID=UPI00106F3441|nr:cytochrome aa3 quinol oxidase subunit II [Ammoniphilus sp. YIM 78166]
MKVKASWFTLITLFSLVLLTGCSTNMVVFQPEGPVAQSILDLINWSLIWMALVVAVVFVLFGYIVWKYRATPENKDYEPPEEHGSTVMEITWTVIPLLIVIALTIPTVTTLYALEDVPKGYEDKEPITIHVTSADWKWIFSYPEQGIETVNYLNIPAGTPIDFRLTSATTMQSFWIPALGGQKYTMNKSENQMYLVADRPGSYLGKNTNFNGRGYTEMEFEVLAQTEKDFEKWVQDVKETAPELTEEKYEELLKPTHLGRLTFSNTHLEWVDHSKPGSRTYSNPELYRLEHGYPGKIFDKNNNGGEHHEQHPVGPHSSH